MMKMKRAVMMAVLAVAVAALALPIVGLRARASSTVGDAKPLASVANFNAAAAAVATPQRATGSDDAIVQMPTGKVSRETAKTLGFREVPKGELARLNAEIAKAVANKIRGGAKPGVSPQSGQPLVLDENGALSAALITTIGGRDTQFSEVALIADWDGREDCAADRENKIDDFSFAEIEIDFTLTKAAISAHTVANGFPDNVFYYGDSIGNFWYGTDTNGTLGPDVEGGAIPTADAVVQVNIPELVTTGASGGFDLQNEVVGDCIDDQVVVTGIAVQPVADLSDFGLCGTVGEVVYVSTTDTEGCADNASNQIYRTRIFAFAFADGPGGVGVVPAGVRQILRSPLSNVAGVTVDDDGSLYFQLVDLIQFTGAAIFTARETCGLNVAPFTTACGVGPRVNRVIPYIPGGAVPTGGDGSALVGGTLALSLTQTSRITDDGDATTEPGERVRTTNYSGTSTTFGNIVAIDAGPCNIIYAAVAQSTDGAGSVSTGVFGNAAALGATPSMIISFADCGGAFDTCSIPTIGGVPIPGQVGIIPVSDGIADGTTTAGGVPILPVRPGINNFRVFVEGNGPAIPTTQAGIIVGSPLKLDMQIDWTLSAGIAVNELGTVFVISGGTPAGTSTGPSDRLGEILCFEDMCPMDRVADFVDLRGDTLPNPPASGGNIGDGDSDRFDHIFYQAPIDIVNLTPTGLNGLAVGHLRYTNRLAPAPIAVGDPLGVTETTQEDDDTTGTIIFETLDPSHQVAGGDDQNPPFRGDDNDGSGTPVLVGALEGGFEFLFGGPDAECVWNGFFLNSNGNITFGTGDTSGDPSVTSLRTGAPRIAPAWADLNPDARLGGEGTEDDNLCAFPVQALGFPMVNAFKIRWINVPEFVNSFCIGTATGPGQINAGRTNTFSVTLFDDGTGYDENEAQALDPADPTGDNVDPAFDEQEGPTDLRFTEEPVTGVNVGCPPRPDGSGHFVFEYCRMDLLGTPDRPVIVGYSIGDLSPLNPPGLCEVPAALGGLGGAAIAADTAAGSFGVFPEDGLGAFANIMPCLIGEGTEPTIFELFNGGRDAVVSDGTTPPGSEAGQVFFAFADFDLRMEGNGTCNFERTGDAPRGKVGFFGVGCELIAPTCFTVVAPTFAVTPDGDDDTDLVDALCNVQLSIVGCGFLPNEDTFICGTFAGETGSEPGRDGKDVFTVAQIACDTNGDGIPEAVIELDPVTPVNKNLVQATIPTIGIGNATAAQTSTGFPFACCGGDGLLTITTVITDGDNNIFGPSELITECDLPLGIRAPIVISVTPSDGNCAVPQDLIVTGACFLDADGAPAVTSVFAIDRDSGARIDATRFVVLTDQKLDAFFNFGSARAGRTFLIFVEGPGGISRNITTGTRPVGTPANCPLGNELGVQVTFTCNTTTTPGDTPGIDIAIVNGCDINRSASGKFTLIITASNVKAGATVSVNGATPKKLKFRDLQPGTNTFNRIIAVGRFCSALPGPITITNPGARPSVPFACNRACPTN